MIHPALLKSSGFSYSERYRQLNAAQAWGINSPAEFDTLEKSEKVEIIAWYEVKWRMDAIMSWEAVEEAKRNSARAKLKNKPK